MKNKIQGYISLLLVVAMMFVVVFGVTTISNKPAEKTETGTSAVVSDKGNTGADTSTSTGSSANTGVDANSGATVAAGTINAADGVYTGESKGFGGTITAKVTIQNGSITAIDVTGDDENEGLGSVAIEKIPGRVVEAQTLEVDSVSGATVSSTAVKAAITAALAQAGVDASTLTGVSASTESGKTEAKSETIDVDIVIVGAGGAGMTAAITAKQAGMKVLIVEKMSYVGGNTTKATGGMNAAETKYQAALGIEDTVEQFVQDTMKGGYNLNDINLVRRMCEESSSAIDWLTSIGAPLPKVSFSGGATNARIHSPEDGSGVGEYLVTAFKKVLDDMNIDVMLDTKATELITKDGTVVGIKASGEKTDYVINAKAVILATGGFGANEDMYVSYRADLKGSVTTNAPGATGDGIVMAEAIGAGLVDMEQIQLHPTVEQNTSMLITEGVRGDGAILVNQSGKRFVNEMLTRDVVSAAELEQEGCYAYVVFDQHLREGLKATEKYIKNGIVVQADTIEDLAKALNIDPSTLSATLADWNTAVATQNDAEFGRSTGMEADLTTAPYYAIKVAPGVHHTMGGVHISTNTEVLTSDDVVIPGLYAAGEVVGGVHGGNRIGGNAVADIVVYGRIAGITASEYVKSH